MGAELGEEGEVVDGERRKAMRRVSATHLLDGVFEVGFL